MFTAKGKTAFTNKIEAAEKELINLCDFLGYGRVMRIASDAWRQKDQHGALQIGSAIGLTEPCGCENPRSCEWCCGTQWLTQKVKAVKTQLEG